jgi:hypothetical protein
MCPDTGSCENLAAPILQKCIEHDLIGIGNFGFVQYVLDVVKLAALPAQKCQLHWG